jgi:predicted SnoaL-like aldol condensation-catalyzing enzyme
MTNKLEQKKQVVLDFYKTAFVEKDPQKAIDLYGGEYYTQHNPGVADGKQAFIDYANKRVKENPNRVIHFKRVISEGDYVVCHCQHIVGENDSVAKVAPHGLASIDIFRLEKNKVVEHWDVIQAIPSESANDNTMF